jgi:hypothetical protein
LHEIPARTAGQLAPVEDLMGRSIGVADALLDERRELIELCNQPAAVRV